jgi:plasmid maintenance system antidote protein VapI
MTMTATNNMPAIGDVLIWEFLEPVKLRQSALAKALGIPQNPLSDIINGRRKPRKWLFIQGS